MNDTTDGNPKPQDKDGSAEAANDFEFLQEKIKERPVNKRRLLKRTIITASMAVLFGLLACLSFLLLEPVLNNWLYPEEEPEVVTFPQEQNEMLPEDMLTEGTTASQEETEEGTSHSSEEGQMLVSETNTAVPGGSEGETDEDRGTSAREESSDAADAHQEDLNEKELNERIRQRMIPIQKAWVRMV